MIINGCLTLRNQIFDYKLCRFAEKGEEEPDKVIIKQLEGISTTLSEVKEQMSSLLTPRDNE